MEFFGVSFEMKAIEQYYRGTACYAIQGGSDC